MIQKRNGFGLLGFGALILAAITNKSTSACWRYNVLVDPDDWDRISPSKRRSYPGPRAPFQSIALGMVFPRDNIGYSDHFQEWLETKNKMTSMLTDMYGDGRIVYTSFKDPKPCPRYDLSFPVELQQIKGRMVFVHTNRHLSDFAKPAGKRTWVTNDKVHHQIPADIDSRLNLPSRTVQVGLEGRIMNPDDLPPIEDADFIYYSPFVKGWRKLTESQVQSMERFVDISQQPIFEGSTFALLTNRPGSRLPVVLVWGAQYRMTL